MSFDIAVSREPLQTRVTLQGDATLGQLLSFLHVLQVDSRQWPQDELMLDLSGVASRFTAAQQSEVQSQAVRLLPWIPRITVRWGPG